MLILCHRLRRRTRPGHPAAFFITHLPWLSLSAGLRMGAIPIGKGFVAARCGLESGAQLVVENNCRNSCQKGNPVASNARDTGATDHKAGNFVECADDLDQRFHDPRKNTVPKGENGAWH